MTSKNNSNMKSMTIVLKVGTSSIVNETTLLPCLSVLSSLVEVIHSLRKSGHSVLLVTSGAVGMGLNRLGLDRKPKHLCALQGLAAIGQGRLMALYDNLFSLYGISIAQVLLTREGLGDRITYLNACNTLKELLSMDVLPIINENDATAHAEIRFGDNDTLSAMVAGMVQANCLFLLTDVDALYSGNPKNDPKASRISVVEDVRRVRESVSYETSGSALGRGGMVTKLIAAELCHAIGIPTIITISSHLERIPLLIKELAQSEDPLYFVPPFGTYFKPKPKSEKMMDKKWWILHGLTTYGTLIIDEGAYRALQCKNSLFAAGVRRVEGTFHAQQAVMIRSRVGQEEVNVGRGICNYSSVECSRIAGRKSSEIESILGYAESEFIIHRDNVVLLPGLSNSSAETGNSHDDRSKMASSLGDNLG